MTNPPDVTPDTPRPDADAGTDVRLDNTPPPPDVPVDNTPPPPDVPVDNTPPPPDVPVDNTPPPPDGDAGCTNDNQCPDNANHCNTSTGQCVSRSSIAITPVNPTIALGTNQQFTATVTYSDNSTGPVTTLVTWTSSDVTHATIGANTGLAVSVAAGTTTIGAALNNLTAQTTLTVSPETLVSLQVQPSTATIPIGLTQAFTVRGTYTDSSTQDLTTQATWTSSDPTMASIGTNTGIATGVAQATGLTITAAFGGQTATATLDVTAATLVNLAILQQNVTIGRQTIQRYTVSGVYSDGSSQPLTTQATWSSSDISVATVSDTAGSKGFATGIAAGTATISAAFGGRTATTTLTVTGAALDSITVNPSAPTIANGLVQQFTATATYTDLTTQDVTTLVTWTSSDTAAAIISNAPGSQGLATTVAPGVTTITANLGTKSGTATMTVTSATLVSIDVQPGNPTIAKGQNQPFTATGTYTDQTTLDITSQVTWTSDNTVAATISNAIGSQGRAFGAGAGTAVITATDPSTGRAGTATLVVTTATLVSIAVTPATPSVAKGNQVQFTAIATYTDQSQADVTTTVTWNATDAAIATIGSGVGGGIALGTAVGSTAITASIGTITGQTTLTVSSALLVSIALSPPAPSLPRGTTVQLTAIGTYTDNTTQDLSALASWSSNAGSFATVNGTGLVTAKNAGSATIAATYNGVSGNTLVTVTPAVLVSISVTPAATSTPAGTDLQFQATGTYTDNTTANVSAQAFWESTDASATVSNGVGTWGLAHGVSVGSSTIRASIGAIAGTAALTITPPDLVSIQVDPPTAQIAAGTTQDFTATGHYSDGSVVDLTQSVTWASSMTNRATITNVAPNKGRATGVSAGLTNITATYNGIQSSPAAVLDVTSANLLSIAVTPNTATIAKGTSVQLMAMGSYSDGSTQNITGTVTWGTNDATHATVTGGLVFGAGAGGASITATVGAVSGASAITVTNATLSSIAVTPATPSIARGTTQQFVATGTYSDTTTQVLTAQVTWGSTTSATATISNGAGTQGLATSVNVGTTNIVASLNGVSGSTQLTVTAATLDSVTIAPDNFSVSLAGTVTVQYVATGSYSNGTSQNITSLCTWDSATPATATISNAPGTKGIATALAQGMTVISVDCPGTPNRTDTTNLTVTP